jgi:1-phosphofructokinase family hexose kinase
MILTVTLNTALDEVLEVEHYVPGERLKVLNRTECIGGKGNLVSAFAADFGMDSVSLGFAAGKNGRRLADLLRRRGVRADFTPAQGETRRIAVVVDRKRRVQTWLLEESLRVNRSAERDLLKRASRWLPRSSWLVLCGSLPAGCSPLLYRRLAKMAHAHNVPVLIDARGPALVSALPARPEVMKLNMEELAATFDARPTSGEAVGVLLTAFVKEGVEWVVCTMGAAGTIAAGDREKWAFVPPAIRARSSAGSGDAFTAALLVWRIKGASWAEALRWAVAAGTAKAREARTDRLEPKAVQRFYRRIKTQRL